MDQEWLDSSFPDLSNIEPLSGGGQKWVFSAIHPTDGDVVLKIIKPGQDPERVQREIEAVRHVNSEHVPRILALGTVTSNVGECIWLREEYIRGETLQQYLSNGALPLEEITGLGEQLLKTVVKAEQVNIVHRDIKPGNIIRDNSAKYWLLDFGLARHLELESRTPTAWHFGVGTLGYGAPEQMRNRKPEIDSRADLFSCGVVLYECATGINPFRQDARNDLEILKRVEQMPLPQVSLQFDRNNAFTSFVMTLTQKFPDRRPRNASDALSWFSDVKAQLGQ